MSSTEQEWLALGHRDGVLTHQEDMAVSHPVNFPSLAVQDRTHGAGMPPADPGLDDKSKYQ